MKCPRCQNENRLDAKFCQECGASLSAHNGDASLQPSYANLEHALKEALEQQTATSEVLKVISRSTFDLQRVLEALIESATRLCGAEQGFIYRFDGELLRLAADYGASAEFRDFRQRNPPRPGDGSIAGRAARDRKVVHVPNILADPEYHLADVQRMGGYRTLLCVPMLRDEVLVGVINMWRTEVRPFSDKQVELITTFADQAVIAIENVRLFTELQSRNRDLTEALEQQTAASEILRVISSSPTDVRPVFDTIAQNARRLCGADSAGVLMYEGELIRLESLDNADPERAGGLRQAYPMPTAHMLPAERS
jgi:transcriptional regulator with GAF, ATPase, and Fis domain